MTYDYKEKKIFKGYHKLKNEKEDDEGEAMVQNIFYRETIYIKEKRGQTGASKCKIFLLKIKINLNYFYVFKIFGYFFLLYKCRFVITSLLTGGALCTGLPFLLQGCSSKDHLVLGFEKPNVPKVHIPISRWPYSSKSHLKSLLATFQLQMSCNSIHVELIL